MYIYLIFDFCNEMPAKLGFCERPRGELNAVCLCISCVCCLDLSCY